MEEVETNICIGSMSADSDLYFIEYQVGFFPLTQSRETILNIKYEDIISLKGVVDSIINAKENRDGRDKEEPTASDTPATCGD